MNCRTCKHNRYEPSMASDDGADGMINNCCHPSLDGAGSLDFEPPEAAITIDLWIREQAWDDECMCPEVTAPCPGFEVSDAR